MNIMFWKRKAPAPLEIGQIWHMSNEDPWRRPIHARILDLRPGWVRYCYADFPDASPSSMRESTFRLVYSTPSPPEQ